MFADSSMKESSLALPVVSKASLSVRYDQPRNARRFMNPGEIDVLVTLVRSVNPKTVIETGVNEGLTAETLLREVPTIERYIGIDLPYGHIPTCYPQRLETPRQAGRAVLNDPRFELILRLRGSRDLTPDDLPLCDAMFIDGDHSKSGVQQDAMLARNLVKPGGIVVYHDYHKLDKVPGVREVLNELFSDGHLIFHVEGTWLAYEKI